MHGEQFVIEEPLLGRRRDKNEDGAKSADRGGFEEVLSLYTRVGSHELLAPRKPKLPGTVTRIPVRKVLYPVASCRR